MSGSMTRLEKALVNRSAHGTRVAVRIEQLLRSVAPVPGATVLDVGCGVGAAALRLASALGLQVTGVDVDPGQIARATGSAAGISGVEFLVADATRLPFADRSFDVVVSSRTLHHVASWEKAVTEFGRVLAPSGALIVSDLAAPSWVATPLRRIGGPDLTTSERLTHAIERLGLTVVESSRRPASVTLIARRPAAAAAVDRVGAPALEGLLVHLAARQRSSRVMHTR